MEAATDALFHGDGLCLPPVDAGETLYSWSARYHMVSSCPRSADTSRRLFGHPTAGLQSSFPFSVDTLAARVPALGTTDEVIFRLTPFGIFARFLEADRICAVVDAMRSSRSAKIPHSLGLLATGLGLPAPLKACSGCIEADLTRGKFARWLVDQQLPGVLVCPTHDCQLQVLTREAHLRTQEQYLLPHQFGAADWHPAPSLGERDFEILRSLANWSRALSMASRTSDASFERLTFRYACHLQAKAKGWVAIDGTLRFKQIREEIQRIFGQLACVPTLEFIADAAKEAGGFVGLLLRDYEGFHHPLMHLVLLSSLFDSPAEYEQTYQRCASQGVEAALKRLTQDRSTLCAMLAQMVGKDACSVSRAAAELNINVRLAVTLLEERNVKYKKRPHIVGTERENELIRRLECGDDRNEIARALAVRRGFIKDYLAGRPELRKRSNAAHLARRRDWYRSRFAAILAANPSLPIKRIRREIDSGFEWLYRNDRAWLEEALPGIWHRP